MSEFESKSIENTDRVFSASDEIKKPVAEENAHSPVQVAEEEGSYLEVSTKDLKFQDVLSLDREGEHFKVAILESLVSPNEKPKISLKELQEDFEKVISILNTEYPNVSIHELLSSGESIVNEKIVKIITPEKTLKNESIFPSEQTKAELFKALQLLEQNIEKYGMAQGVDIKVESARQNALSWVRRNLLGKGQEENFKSELKDALIENLEFLHIIKELGVLTEDVLNQKIYYIDDVTGKAGLGKLSTAIEFSTGHLPYLESYISDVIHFNSSPQAKASKIVKALQMMLGGYGEKPFNLDESTAQFKSGQAFSAGGAVGNYLKAGYIQSVKVVKH